MSEPTLLDAPRSIPSNAEQHIPLLRAGDRLTRAEFERRYHAMPPGIRAELLEGVVIMPSPARAEHHARPHAVIMTWLGVYWARTSGTRLFDNGTLRLSDEDEVQPDAMLLRLPGGNAWISADDYVTGAPELIVEVAASSASYDMTSKRAAYERHGVQEYLVWLVEEERVLWWELQAGVYVPLPRDEEGFITSRIFPGLRLDTAALLAGDIARVLARLTSATL